MSCYHPLVRHPKWTWNDKLRKNVIALTSTGEVIYSITPLQRYEYELNHNNWPDTDTCIIPCGRCVGCKLDHSRQWADRMLCELQSAQGRGVFVTLTYSHENVPFSWYKDNTGCLHRSYTLKKEDLQDFNKNLRRVFDGSGDYKDFPTRRIRFYGAGEYGEMTLRPHYHIIYFGIDLDDLKAFPAQNELGQIVKNELGDIYYRSEILEKKWNKGLVSVAEVSWRTCAYVARYVTKKWQSGYSKDNAYDFFKVEKEFSLMSRRPGIGSEFFEDWKEKNYLEFNKLSLGDQNGAKQIKVPKYIKKKYKESNYESLAAAYAAYVEKAMELNDSRIALQLEKTDKEYLELLDDNERRHKKAITATLRRDKV